VNKPIVKHFKRWAAIALIFYFVFYMRVGFILLLATFADEINAEIDDGLGWLFPGDFGKVRFACVVLFSLLLIAVGIVATPEAAEDGSLKAIILTLMK
jgi:hypothetical protein